MPPNDRNQLFCNWSSKTVVSDINNWNSSRMPAFPFSQEIKGNKSLTAMKELDFFLIDQLKHLSVFV